MKKRNTVIIDILLFMLVINLIGCKKEQPENLEVAVTEETSNSEIPENIEDNAENEDLEEEPISFECLEEIKEASPESGLVQVDDMILQYGCKVSDVIEVIENSKSSFGYLNDYNENELVIQGDSTDIILIKNNDWYLSLQARNLTEGTTALKDCIVGRIITEKAAKGNVFYSGFNENMGDIPTYEYIKNNVMKDYEISYEFTEHDEHDDLKKYMAEVYILPSNLSETGEIWLYFIIEADTGELRSISMNSTSLYSFL